MSKFVVSEYFEVSLDQPVKEFENEFVRSYVAKDTRQPELQLVCLKTSVFPPPRTNSIDKYISLFRSTPSLPMMALVHSVNSFINSSRDSKSILLFYQRPKGQLISTAITDRFTPWSEDMIIDKMIKPVFEVISNLNQRGLTHQTISPFNMFMVSPEKNHPVKLGDSLSVPAGFFQHHFFEPLDYAMTDPIAKGEGTITNDLFALGATVAFLAAGGLPHNLTPDDIISSRIEHGTFNAYIGKNTLSARINELLRGVLHDNEEHRWGVYEVGQWITAGRQTSPMTHPPRRASRPITFNDKSEIYTINTLFAEMIKSPLSALEMVDKNELSMWLKNGLADNHRVHQIEDMKAVLGKDSSSSERLMGVFQIMMPETPFFWQGRFYKPQGIGMAFTNAVLKNDNVETITSLLSAPVLSYYLSVEQTIDPEHADEASMYNNKIERHVLSAKTFLGFTGLGGGVERAIYHMCPQIACLSPIVRSYNALSVTELLYALDDIGMRSNKPELPIDNHIIAYVFSKESSLKQTIIHNLSSGSRLKQIRGALQLLSELQQKQRIKKLTGLCKWFGELSGSVIDGFKNLQYQEHLKAKLQAIIDSGNLAGLCKLIDNRKAIEIDIRGLRVATNEVNFIESSVKNIINTSGNEIHYSVSIGQNNAMALAASLSIIASGIYIFVKAAL